MTTYGVVLVQDLPWPEWRRRLLEVEALGYDTVHVWDHLVHRTLDDSGVLMESFGVLSAAAAVTSRIRLGTLVVSPTLRHPYLLVKQALTLDRVSYGRFDLGIGAAGAAMDFDVLGQEQPGKGELVDRFLATVETVHAHRPLPLTLAAHGPRTLRIAARYAATWTMIADRDCAPDEAVERARGRAALLDRYAEEAGRDPAAIRRSVLLGSEQWPVRRSARDFVAAVERFRAAGFDDFVLMYPDHPAEARTGHGAAAPDIVRSVAGALGLSPRQ